MDTVVAIAAARSSTFSVSGGLAEQFIERGEMIPWSGILVVEGGDTGDRRSIEMGALTMRPLPMPFMVQLENPVGGDGHDGATLTGRIDTLERNNDGEWFATGFIDPTTVDGDKLALALDKQLIRGVSVDLDQVSITEVQGKDGPKQVITSARIIGACATPYQAFVECEIALNVERMTPGALAASADFGHWEDEIEGMLARVFTPTDGIETIVASAGASIPVDPPAAWFTKRTYTELTPLTVLANGQVFGHIAAKGTCHISFANRCQPVPESHTNYAKFRCGSVLTAEGAMVRTGPIVMDTVHPDLRWKASDAMSFYADTGAAVCDVIPYDDQFGIAVAGAMRPDVTPARMRAFRASDISPDWRTIDGYRHECCALLAVNNSGFKLPIALAASAGMYVEAGDTAIALDTDGEVYALVASGPMRAPEPCCDDCAEHFADTTEHALEPDKRLDDEDEKRRAAVRARFAPKTPATRTFRVATATFNGTHEGAILGWLHRRGIGGRHRKPKKTKTKYVPGMHDRVTVTPAGTGHPDPARIRKLMHDPPQTILGRSLGYLADDTVTMGTARTFKVARADFACHDASCAPPNAGGTGGSNKSVGGNGRSTPTKATKTAKAAQADGKLPPGKSSGADVGALAAEVHAGKDVTVHPHDVDDVMVHFADNATASVDLTQVTVAGQPSMFSSVRNAGGAILRKDMPQIPKDRLDQFSDTLAKSGIGYKLDRVDPASLKPTQSELDGRNAGGMIKSMRDGSMSLDGDPIWMSSDGMILDGHHRWAATAALSADCGGCITIPVVRVDMKMHGTGGLLEYARAFNKTTGIQGKAFAVSTFAKEHTVSNDKVTGHGPDGNPHYAMATDEADGVDPADLDALGHGDKTPIPKPKKH